MKATKKQIKELASYIWKLPNDQIVTTLQGLSDSERDLLFKLSENA
jgi:hypothetical protein